MDQRGHTSPNRLLLLAVDTALYALALFIALTIWRSRLLIPWLTRLPFYVIGQCLTVSLPCVLLTRLTARIRVGWLLDMLIVSAGEWLFLMLAYLVVLICVYLPPWFGHRPLFAHSDSVLVYNYLFATILIISARLIGRVLRQPASVSR